MQENVIKNRFPNKQTNEERDNKVGWFSYPLSLFKNYFSTISKKKTGRSIEFLGFSATRSRVPIFPISNHRRTSINPLPPPRKQAQFRRAVLSAKVGSRGCGATWNSLRLWRREAGGRERNEGPILVGNNLSCSFKSLKLECENKKKKKNKQTGRGEQHVQNVVGHELHLRLVDADLRESTAQLALHLGLQAVPRLHDTSLPHQVLSRPVGSSYGDVAGPERG